ncbi:hypothetical protein BS47DRAFT_1340173 [Hydnum rufescens UP504]|uniref:P-loop containing nucleoside triphosphate hydrolase protein n=1 Tax=Hydnum rufescens UP504 TaxID=1448309 RepID=A0A9P6B3N8_9AGAM|nr:hypothetical protein BS47DRAFT_1340173 [Hydnum rufescens UP504]
MIPDGVQAILAAVQNVTAGSNVSYSPGGAQLKPQLSDIPSFLAFILSMGGLGDWLKLFIFGGLVESARRLFTMAYNALLASFVLTLHFDGDETPYQWLMVWLSKQEAWTKARTIHVSSQNFGLKNNGVLLVPGEETDGKEGARPLSMLPNFDTTHSLWFRRRLMRVTRSKKYLGEGQVENSLMIQVFTRSHKTVHALLLEAKQQYEAETESRVSVFVADTYNNWYYAGSRPKRSMDSVVIPADVKELLIEDAKDFMMSESWYGQRGIPWQRGWLLYGVPGSGKTSIIQALAGTLGINIYVVSLAKRGLDDTNLSELLNSIPSRSIVLMEDIDAAFTRTVTREAPIDPQVAVSGPPTQSATSTITLSGLLNAIDGVQAQQGRLLFATTNKYTALDPALVRPGRLDVHIEFKLATKWQAAELFKRFYPIDDVTLSPPPVPNDSNEVDAVEGDLSELSEKASVFSSVSSSDTRVEMPDLMTTTTGTMIHQAARSRHSKAPRLTPEQLRTLAQGFADCIPEEELSMASLQGHLMMHKTRPDEAVRTAPAFVIKQREVRAKARTIAETAPVAPVIPAPLIGPVAPVALVGTVTPVTSISPLPSVSHPSLVPPTDDPSPALVPVVETTASL